MKNDYFYYAFIAFIFARFFLSGIFSTIHTIIVFSVPLIYILYNRHYHIFKFEVHDTVQSVLIDSLFAFILSFFVLFGAIFFGNINWVNIFEIPAGLMFALLLLSFNYELLVRYFLQGFLEKRFGEWVGFPVAAFIGSVLLLPDILSFIIFLISGLLFGWVFRKTNDIYGPALAGFVLRIAISALAM